MADNSTGLIVKSLATETVRAKLVDTGGTNEAAISAAGRISVDGSGVTQPVSGTVAVSSITTSVTPGTAATNLGKAQGAVYSANDVGVMSLGVRNDAGTILTGSADQDYVPLTTDATGALRVTGGSAGTQYVGDAAATATPTGTMAMGLGNAAAPSDVSANNDAVAAWYLRNGSAVVNLASGGTLVTLGQKVMASSVPVVISSDQSAIAVTPAANSAVNVAQVAGTNTVTGGTAGSLGVGGTVAHDAVGTGVNPALIGGYASAAAPTDVSADGDSTRIWTLRNGSQVVNLASGGTLVTLGQGAMAASLPVVIASNQSAITVDTELTAVAALADATANPTITNIAGYLMGFNGTTWDRVRTANTGRLQVDIVTGAGGTQYVGDAAATATPTGTMGMGLANAAAPSDVSANNDAVAMWMLRNGSPVVNLASSGTLITVGQKTMANAFSVSIASDQSNLPTNITQIGGAAPSATVFLPARLTDGTAYYANTGQTAATAPFTRITDATNTAAVIASILSLKTDASSIAGAVPSATNPLPVRLTDGAAFYASTSATPVDPKFSTKTSSALGAGASVDLTHYVTSGKTGHLMGVDVTSTVALKCVINTEVTASKTTRVVLFALAGQPIIWRTPYKTFITRASADSTSGFSVTITNKDGSVAADVYSTGYWDEV